MMSDTPTPPNGDIWELMHYVHLDSSHLPLLGGVDASDIIDIALEYRDQLFKAYRLITQPLFRLFLNRTSHIGALCQGNRIASQ